MRATLDKLPGVKGAEITAGNAEITVHYDPATTNVDQLLAGMATDGQPAKKK